MIKPPDSVNICTAEQQ